MAKKENTNANSLRTPGFSEFEATHEFNAESKLADFTRAAIKAELSNAEIIEIGESIGLEMKLNCINWYRSSDPVLNPGKVRYKATGAKSIEVRSKVSEYFNTLGEDEQASFIETLVQAIGADELIKNAKVETLKAIAPAELFPVAVKKEKKELSDVDKLLKKQEAAEKKAAKLRAQLAELEGTKAPAVEA